MRLWSLHPSLLDWQGLGGLWREGLGAQKALVALERGEKVGYQSHPQLERFKATEDPVLYISAYLWGVVEEANEVRGYHYDKTKIACGIDEGPDYPLKVTRGQMDYEMDWLRSKLEVRSPLLAHNMEFRAHDLFDIVEGDVEPWERRK